MNKSQPTYPHTLSTAVVIVMPLVVQRVALPIIATYAPTALAWYPPHITLIIPFAPMDTLREACDKLERICQSIAPIEVTLDGYCSFPNTAYMKLADPTPVQKIFETIFAQFPDYPPYGGRFGKTLSPHVTVAQGDDVENLTLPDYEPITFPVNCLHVIYGSHDAPYPFITFDVVKLG